MTANEDIRTMAEPTLVVEQTPIEPDPAPEPTPEEPPVVTMGPGPDDAAGSQAADAVVDEMDVLDPPPDRYTMSDGTVVVFERLKTRQFFKLLRIVTHGAVDTIGFLQISPGMSNEEFTTRILAVILFAVPDAEDEALEFLRSMVYLPEPHVPDDTPPAEVGNRLKAIKAMEQRNLDVLFSDPELDDTLGLVEAIVRREAPDLKALGKRLGSMMQIARKTGQIPNEPPSAVSPAPST